MTELETWLARFKTVVHFVPQTSSLLKKALQSLPVSPDVDAIFVKTITSCTDLSEAEQLFSSYRVFSWSSVSEPGYFYANVELFADNVLNAVRANADQPVLFDLSAAPKCFILALQQRALQKCDSNDAIHFAMIDNTNRLVVRFTLTGMQPPLSLPETEESAPNVEDNTPSQPDVEQSQKEKTGVAVTAQIQTSLPQKQQIQHDAVDLTAPTTKCELIDYNDFPSQQQVIKRREFVFHLWDYRTVILCGKDGSIAPDMPKLKDATISTVHSHTNEKIIKVTRSLDNRTIIINTRENEPYFCSHKGKCSGNKSYQFNHVLADYVAKIWSYFGGVWFEEYVYLILQENKAVQALGLHYKRTIAVPRFEIDVVAFCSDCYYLLSCKTGTPDAKHVTEHNELIKQLRLNGINCQGILCYARDANPPENLKDSEISCVCGGSLGDILKTKLTKLQPGVVYK